MWGFNWNAYAMFPDDVTCKPRPKPVSRYNMRKHHRIWYESVAFALRTGREDPADDLPDDLIALANVLDKYLFCVAQLSELVDEAVRSKVFDLQKYIRYCVARIKENHGIHLCLFLLRFDV